MAAVCCYLASSSMQTHRKAIDSASVVLSALYHQSAAVQHVTEQKQSCVLSPRGRQEGVCFHSVQGAAGQTADRVCTGPYVSYEGRQAAVVSPQSVGLEASLAPLQCFAIRAWLRPGSVGCLVERSRCIRRRCRWGSAGIKTTHKEVKVLLKPSRLFGFNPHSSFFSS